jgi:basic membrane protein A
LAIISSPIKYLEVENMKRITALLLAAAMMLAMFAGCGSDSTSAEASAAGSTEATEAATDGSAAEATASAGFSVAMITDYGDITDQSFNQTTYEACKEYCEANGVQFTYYKPAGDSTAERVAMVEKAVDEGYTVVVMPGYAFGETITETANTYPDITFIALDVSESDLGDFTLPSNVYCAVYQEELCGYMAGYAAVKMGYTHLGFLGGMAVPAVIRYGYGYIQGADAAAAETGADVTVEYAYGNQFYGDSDITAYMDNWYQTLGVEVVFACGGGIYTSAAEAAAKVDGAKVIGVDVDQAGIIDSAYGEGMTLTSAMKGLAPTVEHMLEEIAAGNFANYGGKIETLGLISADDPDSNYVQIPTASTLFNDTFTEDDYKALVKDMFDGTITVSNDTSAAPADMATTATVNDYGNIK